MEKSKCIVKQLALSFIVVLSIYSCQKDDAVPLASQTQQLEHSTTKTVSASEIPKVMQFLQSKSNNRLEFLVDDSNTELGMYRSHEENLSMTNALTEHIKMMTNAYGKSNYTFELIEQDDKTGIYFINLVVKEYRDTLYMYIIKYVPDSTWLQTHHMIKDFNIFTGKLYIYNDLGVYVGKVEMLDGQATLGFQKHPCNGESGTSTSTGNTTGTSSGVGTNSSSTVGVSSTSSSGTTTGGGSEGIPCRWEIYESDDCDCVPNLVIICPEEAFDVDRSALSNALRHPCDGNGTGSSGNLNNPDCEEEDPCNFPMYLDENCDCVEAEAIENSGVAVVNSDKEHCKKLKALIENSDINQKLATLISSSNNNNYEEGFRVMTFNGETQTGDITNNEGDNCAAVDIRIHQFVHMAAHSHPAGCDIFGMFSGADLGVFARMARLYNDQDGIASNNYKDPTFMLAYVNTVFAINFDNPSAMTNLIELFDDSNKAKKIKRKLNRVYINSVPQGQQTANIGDLMTAFLKVLEDNGLEGISLYQAEVNNDNQVTGWQKKIRNDNGTLGTVNCN